MKSYTDVISIRNEEKKDMQHVKKSPKKKLKKSSTTRTRHSIISVR